MSAGGRVGERGLLIAALLLSSCGYTLTASGRLTGGVTSASVAPFANESTEPELGSAVAGALREELAARGLLARSGGGAVVDGEVTATVPSPAAPGGVSWRFSVEVRARLLQGGRVLAERKLRREADFPAGMDALETEGRRAQASRRLAAALARELVDSLME